MRSLYHAILTGSLVPLFGCATVPSDAPENFHAAATEIEAARDDGTETVFPVTIERAEENLEAAVATLEESRDLQEEGKPEGEAQLTQAMAEADRAFELASQARRTGKVVNNWDQDIDQVAQTREGIVGLAKESVTSKLAAVAATGQAIVAEETAQDLMAVPKTVSFFAFNDTSVNAEGQERTEDLAELMNRHESLQIVLKGTSDGLGSTDANARVARLRAENIAALLERNGVAASRIMIETPSVLSSESRRTIMGRRVDATFRTPQLAH